ncbi:MAG: DUF2855 family protein [Pseudomonadales bacterium]|nr:DUF2855 family protein [Pseudomonadales bacterium]
MNTSAPQNTQMLVAKNDLSTFKFEHSPKLAAADLVDGQVLLEVENFALTANNITYAVAGDSMGYWQFFPAQENWGRIPVWGFAHVSASKHPDVTKGDRVYGYLPMGTQLIIQAERVSDKQLIDGSAHRAGLAPVYNQLLRVHNPPDADADALQMLYRPLFMTSWLLDDFLAHNEFFGARQIILTSASSKTSFGLAFMLAQREDIKVVGLTSPDNVDFVNGLGFYDQVVPYDSIATLDAATDSVIVDMAGNGSTLAAVHNHFDSALRYSCLVGATHWSERSGAQDMAGPKPELFFAPNHIKERSAQWGPGGLENKFDAGWQAFTTKVGDWVTVENCRGEEAVGKLYSKLLAGQTPPDVGYIANVDPS